MGLDIFLMKGNDYLYKAGLALSFKFSSKIVSKETRSFRHYYSKVKIFQSYSLVSFSAFKLQYPNVMKVVKTCSNKVF